MSRRHRPALYESPYDDPPGACFRYNKLLAVMKTSLASVRKALVGQMVMTEELDAMGTSMYVIYGPYTDPYLINRVLLCSGITSRSLRCGPKRLIPP